MSENIKNPTGEVGRVCILSQSIKDRDFQKRVQNLLATDKANPGQKQVGELGPLTDIAEGGLAYLKEVAKTYGVYIDIKKKPEEVDLPYYVFMQCKDGEKPIWLVLNEYARLEIKESIAERLERNKKVVAEQIEKSPRRRRY